MKTNINEDELKLLAYLHEHARGYDESYSFDPTDVIADLKLDEPSFAKQFSYLRSFGLIGGEQTETYGTDEDVQIVSVYLTGQGENFMRELESAPGVGKRLTVTVVSELWAMGRGAIVSLAPQILGQFALHHR